MVRCSTRRSAAPKPSCRSRRTGLLAAYVNASLVFALLMLAGCQNGPRVNTYIEAMAAERRALEDRVYSLEYELDKTREELVREQSRRGAGGSGSGSDGRSGPFEDRGERRPATPGQGGEAARSTRGVSPKPKAEPESGSKLGDDSMLQPPVIEPGEASTLQPLDRPPPASELMPPEPTEPALETPPTATSPVISAPEPSNGSSNVPSKNSSQESPKAPSDESSKSPASEATPSNPPLLTPPDAPRSATRPLGPPISAKRPSSKAASATKTSTRPASGTGTKGRTSATRPASGTARVSSIALAPQPTGGVDLDDTPGDDGVAVALELRDERGSRVHQPGAVSVVVLDLSQSGPAARVARWDLDREQVEQLADTADSRAAMVLHMAWPADPPKRERLQMHVRYVTDDGRKLEAYRDIQIKLPSGSTRRPSPSEQSSIQPAAKTGGWRPKGPNLGSPNLGSPSLGSPSLGSTVQTGVADSPAAAIASGSSSPRSPLPPASAIVPASAESPVNR